MRGWRTPSTHVVRDAVLDVVVIAGRFVDQIARLSLGYLVGGTRHYRLLAACFGRERVAEGAESEAAEILAQRRGGPRPAAVARHFDRVDTVAAVPGDAPDANRSHPHICAIYLVIKEFTT